MKKRGLTSESVSKQTIGLLVVALSTHFAAPWLWDDYIYPFSTAIFPGSRIIYSLVPLAICCAFLLGRSGSSALLHSKVLFWLGLTSAPVGTLVAVLVLWTSFDPWPLLLGIALFGAGRLFVFLILSGELLKIDLRVVVAIAVAALLLSGVWDLLASIMPQEAAYLMAILFEGVSVLCCRGLSRCAAQPDASPQPGQGASRVSEPHSQRETTTGFWLTHQRLVSLNFLFTIGAFFMVFGFSGRYYEGESGGSSAFFWSFVPLLLLGVWMSLRPKSFSLDPMYRVALILTALGFVCVAFPGVVSPRVANMIVMGGSHCFVVLYWAGLCSSCQKRPGDAATVLFLGRSFASGGTLFGTLLAMGMLLLQSYDAQIGSFVAAVIALFYMVMSLVVLRNLDGIAVPSESDEQANKLERLAKRYGLTSREKEIVSLLAKGRNAQYIQDKLFVSKNTVKSHMKHIYAKMGVHTQQELLSLFEETE